MLDGRLPGQLLQEPIQLGTDLRATPPVRQLGRDRQSHGAAAIGHGEMAIGDQDLQRRTAVPKIVDKEIRLLFQAGACPAMIFSRRAMTACPAGTTYSTVLPNFLFNARIRSSMPLK